MRERWKEISGILMLAVAVYLFLSLVSFRLEDIPFHSSRGALSFHNWAGKVGAYTAFFIYFGFGLTSFFIPLFIFAGGVILLKKGTGLKPGPRLLGSLLIFFTFSCLLALLAVNTSRRGYLPGGIFGAIFTQKISPYFGGAGSYIILLALLSVGLLLVTDFTLARALALIKRPWPKLDLSKRTRSPKIKIEPGPKKVAAPPLESKQVVITKPSDAAVFPARRVEKIERKESVDFTLPSLAILDEVPQESSEPDEVLMTKARELEKNLANFDIEARVVEIHQGPAITSFELEPAVGVKVHRITALQDDIALALKARSIRIVAPIPGKSAIGIEMPNDKARTVSLREMLISSPYRDHLSKLKIGMGKDILGETIIADLGEMPHLLIAGTTGSGKTVFLNSLIASILFNATPEDVRFLMVDPKMVELAPFNGLPHLLVPVVTDIKKLAPVLKWIIREMERRYELLARVGVRNIDGYNQLKVSEDDLAVENPPLVMNEDGKMPYLVIIIDELADIMVIAQNQVEDAITRLAQLSRAVGIHIVLATQRPSVDVITGIIKANFPYRISFQVSSKVDSRTVLDMNGAETLLGRGDMLYLPANLSKPIRLQGAMVKDGEIKKLVEVLSKQAEPAYYEEDIFKSQTNLPAWNEDEPDEFYDEAVRLVKESGRASVSYLQRRFKIGYTRAARLMDRMEDEGIVGPFQGSRARAIMPEDEERSRERRENGDSGENT